MKFYLNNGGTLYAIRIVTVKAQPKAYPARFFFFFALMGNVIYKMSSCCMLEISNWEHKLIRTPFTEFTQKVTGGSLYPLPVDFYLQPIKASGKLNK